MKMKQTSSNLVPSILLFSLLVAVAAGGVGAALVGQWKPIENLNDPHLVELAEFAVSEYDNRSKADLTFEEVIHGETQVVSGMNYKLVLTANDGSGVTSNYEAIVWEHTSLKLRNLNSFKPAV